ncbi:hypothetical protein O181_002871 [Austropuccinia psidii MF-1]|uniref:Reverse transcriptase domain-containing protein n=1 Tax=Austropuccinia psidii MF-1 TaxID=1389203 RepID=A0A9Q3BCQ8_9BASI|nr:hypothetical protein [Austropuccinia psidii MF-1]
MDNPYHQEDIKPDAMLVNKARSPSQYQDGDNMSYSDKEALKQLPEASSWPNFSGTGEYDHMKLIDHIYEPFIDVPRTPYYWIIARLNTALKGHASIWYTEMKWPEIIWTTTPEIWKHIYQISAQDPLEELLNEFREGQFSTTLTSKQKLSLLKMLMKNRQAFAIGEEPLGKIRGHYIELYLDVERPYPPMLRRPPYPESLETRKEIEKHINELLDMDVIRKIGHNEIVEITTFVLITWNEGKSRLCGDFRALNNYPNTDRYPIPRIPHALEKLEKAKYITKMNFMKGFHQNVVKPNSIKLLIIIFHMSIYEYTRMPFGIKYAPAHFQRIMDTTFQEELLEGWMVVYIDDIIIYSETLECHVQYIDRVLSKFTPINLKISLKKCNFGQQDLLALGNKVSCLNWP